MMILFFFFLQQMFHSFVGNKCQCIKEVVAQSRARIVLCSNRYSRLQNHTCHLTVLSFIYGSANMESNFAYSTAANMTSKLALIIN